MSFRFLHLADLHLETRFGGRPDTRERLRQATHEAFARAVDYAIENRLDALLAAGDLFDDEILSVRTELFFASQLARLAQAGVWFLAACGNHDPGGAGFRTADLGVEGERVRFFRGAEPQVLRVTNREGAPVGVVVGAGHESDQEAANLAASFPLVAGPAAGGGAPAHERREREVGRRPRSLRPLDARGLRAARPTRTGRSATSTCASRPSRGLPVHYAGNLQGRHVGETGEKGGLVVEAFPGASAEPRFVPLRAGALGARCRARASSASRLDRCARGRARAPDRGVAAVGADEQLALRLELEGETPLAGELRVGDVARVPRGRASRPAAACSSWSSAPTGPRCPSTAPGCGPRRASLAAALALIERARADDALLAALVPAELAHPAGEGEARLAYLRQLLEGLPEELLLRGVEREGA